MVQINKLIDYSAQFLNVGAFRDYCPNGLQVEGRKEIQKVIAGVSASKALIEEAIKQDADLILVHHGYFWKNEEAVITGMKRERIRLLLAHNINLVAYHLPLDAHPDVGNNAMLAKQLGFTTQYTCAEQNIMHVGACELQRLDVLGNRIELALARKPLVIGNPNQNISKVAWCTGGAQGYFSEAIKQGVDAFVTGEISEQMVDMAHESGVAFISAGHYATEKYGVAALAKHWEAQFNLSINLFYTDNPV
ncbi:Nif3-like dinuclear metal center hexameric protein [Leeia speluncae]|nr:Nif3-like dinuclear metal center hexameric protein [Leeia speluncae]